MTRDLFRWGAESVSYEQVRDEHQGLARRVVAHLAARLPASRTIDRNELEHVGLVHLFEALARAEAEGRDLPTEHHAAIIENGIIDWIKVSTGFSRSKSFRSEISLEYYQEAQAQRRRDFHRGAHGLLDFAFTELSIELAMGITLGRIPPPRNPERAALLGQFGQHADAAIDELDEPERTVIRLWKSEDLSNEEIAARMRISVSYVKQCKQRGMERLKLELHYYQSSWMRMLRSGA